MRSGRVVLKHIVPETHTSGKHKARVTVPAAVLNTPPPRPPPSLLFFLLPPTCTFAGSHCKCTHSSFPLKPLCLINAPPPSQPPTPNRLAFPPLVLLATSSEVLHLPELCKTLLVLLSISTYRYAPPTHTHTPPPPSKKTCARPPDGDMGGGGSGKIKSLDGSARGSCVPGDSISTYAITQIQELKLPLPPPSST